MNVFIKVEEITPVKGPFIFTLGWGVEVEVAIGRNGPQKTGTARATHGSCFFFFLIKKYFLILNLNTCMCVKRRNMSRLVVNPGVAFLPALFGEVKSLEVPGPNQRENL